MFEHFIFGAAARPGEDFSYDVSPCDISPLSEQPQEDYFTSAPRTSISELLSGLNGHSLEAQSDDEKSSSYLSGRLGTGEREFSYPILEVDNEPERDDIATICSLITARSAEATLQCRRLQRQRNTQLLCTASQRSSLNQLVAEMVSLGEQCNVATSLSLPPTPSSPTSHMADNARPVAPRIDDDEGFCDGEEDDTSPEAAQRLLMTLRRASGQTGVRGYGRGSISSSSESSGEHGGRVPRAARIRKRVTKSRKAR